MKQKIKNYQWNGFGFPVIFSELPAVKLRGEVIPDVDFTQFAKPLIQIICAEQPVPLSGNQVKFIRHHLDMTLREFARFMDVTHQSVMRWEEKTKSPARIDVNTEIVFRLKVLRALGSDQKMIAEVVNKVDHIDELKPAPGYVKNFPPIHLPKDLILATI